MSLGFKRTQTTNQLHHPTPIAKPELAHLIHNHDEIARLFFYFALVSTLGTALYLQLLPASLWWLVLIMLGIFVAATLVSVKFKQTLMRPLTIVLAVIDAVIVGGCMALLQSQAFILVLLLIMANASFLMLSVVWGYFLAWLACLCGFLLAMQALVAPASFVIDDFILQLVCAISVGLYVSVLTILGLKQRHSLQQARYQLHQQKERYKDVSRRLSRYLSPPIWQAIFAGKEVKLETQRKKLTVFFSDIKGFTELSDQLEAEDLTELLNSYLNDMAKIAQKYGGTLDKFIGDAVMVFFGDPQSNGIKEDASAAVWMAIEMRKHMKILRNRWRAQGIERPLEIRMGVNTGFCTVGNFGAEVHMDYTIIGKQVNLASRLESMAGAGDILISQETYAQVKDTVICKAVGDTNFKGFNQAVKVFKVLDYRHKVGAVNSFSEFDFSGFSLQLSHLYHVLQQKIF